MYTHEGERACMRSALASIEPVYFLYCDAYSASDIYRSLNFTGVTLFVETDKKSQEWIRSSYNRSKISGKKMFISYEHVYMCTCIFSRISPKTFSALRSRFCRSRWSRVSDMQVLFARLCDARILWQLEIGTRYLLCNSREVFSRCPPVVISGDLVNAPDAFSVTGWTRRKSASLFSKLLTYFRSGAREAHLRILLFSSESLNAATRLLSRSSGSRGAPS